MVVDATRPDTNRPACPGEGACAGYCDGSYLDCVFPMEDVECGPAECSAGSVFENVCSGGTCDRRERESCAHGCADARDDAGVRCLECAVDADCGAVDRICSDDACVPRQPTCKDSTTLVTSNLTEVDCTPSACVDGACGDGICTSDSDCSAGWVCDQTEGACKGGPSLTGFTRVEIDDGCSCRTPGSSDVGGNAAIGVVAVAMLAACRRSGSVGWALAMVVGALLACGTYEDLTADELCKDVGYSLSNRMLQCTDDAERAVKVFHEYEKRFRCRVKRVNETIEAYYQCPVALRSADCDALVNGDLEDVLARYPICRLVVGRASGEPIPTPADAGGPPPSDGGVDAGQGGAAGADGSAGSSGLAGQAGSGASGGSAGAGAGGSAGVGAAGGAGGTAGSSGAGGTGGTSGAGGTAGVGGGGAGGSAGMDAGGPGIAGSVLWLRADSLRGVLGDGAAVAQWLDSSGTGADASQPVSGKQPVFSMSSINGLPAVTFDGVDDRLENASASFSSTHSIFAVWTIRAETGDGWAFVLRPSASTYSGFSFRLGMPNKLAFETSQGTLPILSSFVTSSVEPSASPFLVSATISGLTGMQSQNLYIDGVLDEQAPMQAGNSAQVRVGYSVGEMTTLGGVSADVAEIIVYDTALADPDRLQVEAYLRAKYGL